MNGYIEAQIMNMVLAAKSFDQTCKMAAMKDDGTIDKVEAQQLKKIHAATQRFIQNLEKIK